MKRLSADDAFLRFMMAMRAFAPTPIDSKTAEKQCNLEGIYRLAVVCLRL